MSQRKSVKDRIQAIGEKIHPALPVILDCYSEALKAVASLGKNPPREIVLQVQARLRANLEQKLCPWPELPGSVLNILYDFEQLTAEKALRAFLHFNRHGKSLTTDHALATREYEAHKRIIRTEEDFATLRHSKGPISPSKFDAIHSDIFACGLGMGLEKLTPEELADFFEMHCWCGEEHDPDSLKKQRARRKTNFAAAFDAGKPLPDTGK